MLGLLGNGGSFVLRNEDGTLVVLMSDVVINAYTCVSMLSLEMLCPCGKERRKKCLLIV